MSDPVLRIETETQTPPTIRISESDSGRWPVFGTRVPRDEITFFAQVIIVYVVIVTCIINLSIGNGESNLWTALLSSCLGYILPSPKMKNHSVLR